MAELIINDSNYLQHIAQEAADGRMKGCKPRSYKSHPQGYLPCARPFDFLDIPESEWEDRLKARIAAKAQLSDIRNTGNNGKPIPSRDQNGRGYCWFHSGVSAHLIARAIMGEPYADLSAYAGACIIKNFRDEGGWGSEGIEWQGEHGCPTSRTWPQQSVSRSNVTDAMYADAAQHKIVSWVDLNPNNSKTQLVTCLLMGIPVVVDFNWWSHSVCAVDLVSINPFRIRIWNSWGDGWSENGMGILEGSKAIPDGALAPDIVTPSAA